MSKESFDKIFSQPPKEYYPPRELRQCQEEIRRLQARIADYENGIAWGTSCTNCANLLDQLYAATEGQDEEYQHAWHKGYYAGYCDADSGFEQRVGEEGWDGVRQD